MRLRETWRELVAVNWHLPGGIIHERRIRPAVRHDDPNTRVVDTSALGEVGAPAHDRLGGKLIDQRQLTLRSGLIAHGRGDVRALTAGEMNVHENDQRHHRDGAWDGVAVHVRAWIPEL